MELKRILFSRPDKNRLKAPASAEISCDDRGRFTRAECTSIKICAVPRGNIRTEKRTSVEVLSHHRRTGVTVPSCQARLPARVKPAAPGGAFGPPLCGAPSVYTVANVVG